MSESSPDKSAVGKPTVNITCMTLPASDKAEHQYLDPHSHCLQKQAWKLDIIAFLQNNKCC